MFSTAIGAMALGSRRLWSAEETFPKTRAVLRGGMQRGLHIGAQVHVARDGRTAADIALGEARPGVAMRPDSLMTWFSMTKPVTSMCIGQCWERGKVQLDDPVAKYVPEFGKHGKERVTIRHVLTHTSGFPKADDGARSKKTWEEVTALICDARLEEGWEVGRHALYHPSAGMHMLGEIVQRVSGKPFSTYVREEIFIPLGMRDSWVGMPAEVRAGYGDRIGMMMDTDGEKPVETSVHREIGWERWATLCIPGGNGHGPMKELTRFYEAMLGRGAREGKRVLAEKTVDEFTKVHRPSAPTFRGKNAQPPWGLGISRLRGIGGAHAAEGTFGHGGSASSISFCDPVNRVVAAVVCNGRCKPPEHAARMREIATAIYADLGLAKT